MNSVVLVSETGKEEITCISRVCARNYGGVVAYVGCVRKIGRKGIEEM